MCLGVVAKNDFVMERSWISSDCGSAVLNCNMSQPAVIRWHEGGEAPLLDDAEYVPQNTAADVVDENACLCPDSECGRRERLKETKWR